MQRLPPATWLQWLTLTVLAAGVLVVLARAQDELRAPEWILLGIVVSLVTLVASKATVILGQVTNKPLHRMLVETSLRLSIPLGVLLAIVITRRDLLSSDFLLYFLPFQLVTIVVGAIAAVRDING